VSIILNENEYLLKLGKMLIKKLVLGITLLFGGPLAIILLFAGLIGIGTIFPMSVSGATINCVGIVIPDVWDD